MSITSYNSIFSKPFPKTLILEFDDDPQTVISNDKVVQESMELEETLCSDSNLKYGCCESSCFNVRVVNNGSLKGKTFTAKLQFQSRGILINDSGDYIENDEGSYIETYNSSNVDTITIGNYKVYSDKPTSDRAYRDLMCYDLMYDILDVDVASWYNGLTFPMTLKSFRDSLFTYLGVTQETTTLINDNYSVKGNYQVDSLSCKDVLQSICEANGVFGHINRSGNFEYISLPSVETVVLDHHINGKGGYEDFVTSAITGVECIPIDSDIGTKVGTDTNLYILDNNLIFYGDEGSQEQVAALTNLLNKIKTFTYRPCSITTYGNPMMEIGTSIVDTVNDLIVESFVMSRYLSGIQAMKDEYRAYGDEKYPENANSLKTSVKRLSGKTIKLDTEITNMGAKTVLKLTADGRIVEVALDATPSGSSVKIKADNIDFIADGKIQLTSKSLAISSTNFEVTSAGVITAKSGTIGPWKMTATDLYDSAADSGTGVGAGIGKNGTTFAFWAGSNYANRNSAPFRVGHNGAVNASNITATGGKVGNYTINNGALKSQSGYSKVELYPAYIYLADDSTNLNIQPNQIAGRGTNIVTSGTKNRLVETTDYGDRLLYCYETPSPLFGDVGEGVIAEDGKCYIWLDSVFAQTINSDGYQVFLQKYGQGECYVTERKSNYFVVEGDSGLAFGWEIKARQSDFDMRRLETYDDWEIENTDYGKLSIEHLDSIRKEREVA